MCLYHINLTCFITAIITESSFSPLKNVVYFLLMRNLTINVVTDSPIDRLLIRTFSRLSLMFHNSCFNRIFKWNQEFHFRNSKLNTVVSLKSVLAYVANFSESPDFQDSSFLQTRKSSDFLDKSCFSKRQKSRFFGPKLFFSKTKVQIFRKCSRYADFGLSLKVDGQLVWTW